MRRRNIAAALAAAVTACSLLILFAWTKPDAAFGAPRARPLPPAQIAPPQTPGDRLPPARSGVNVRWEQYRLGDSPLDADGLLEWTKPGATRTWQRMTDIRNRDAGIEAAGGYAWFAGRILANPSGKPVPDAYLLFKRAPYAFEVYLGGDLIFRYGDMNSDRPPLMPDKPIFLSLQGHAPDQPLLLRIHSQRSKALSGKIGPVLYGSQADLKMALIKEDLLSGLGLIIFLIIGLVALLLFLINREHAAALYFALFSLTICCHLLFALGSLDLFFHFSAFRMYAKYPLYGCMVYLFTLYFVSVLKPVFERFIRVAGKIILARGLLMAVAMLLVPSAFNVYSDRIETAENIAFSLLCAVCLVIIALSLRKRTDSDAKWFVAGCSLFLIVNMIGQPLLMYIEAHLEEFSITPIEFIRWLHMAMDYSLLFSTFFFGMITFKRFAEVYRATRSYNEQLADWNQSLESKVRERTQAIQNLLDYAGQGFLTFDRQLAVQEEYSIECRRLFRREIAAHNYVELLYPDDADERSLHADILDSVFQEDELRREVCLSLLPTETEVSGKRVALQYKWIPGIEASSGKVMVILTDVSERRRLESQMAKERRTLQTIVWVTKHDRDFREMIGEYRAFATTGKEELMRREMPAADKWEELSRIIHTFKGNFAQIDFACTTGKLHELEARLDEWKRRPAGGEPDSRISSGLEEWLEEYDLLAWLEEDLRLLRDMLGEQFDIGPETVTIEIERLRRLERQAHAALPGPQAEAMAKELRKLRHRPFRELLGMYPEYAAKLAERTGKALNPVRIVGGDMSVDPDVYMDFARSLIHVFRNMIDHGIERPEERASIGKDRCGTIVCQIIGDEREIRLNLWNDGREMNVPEIGKQALDRGICTAEEIAAMSDDEQRMLVFREGFTTKQTISELSGRGIGLSAVRKALDNLQGTVRIESGAASGTAFLFALPWID